MDLYSERGRQSNGGGAGSSGGFNWGHGEGSMLPGHEKDASSIHQISTQDVTPNVVRKKKNGYIF